MKKKLFVILIGFIFIFSLFSLNISAAEVVPDEEGSNIFSVTVPSPQFGQFAAVWDTSFSSLTQRLNSTPFWELEVNTRNYGDIETGITSDYYNREFEFYQYYNIYATNSVGAATLCYYNPITFDNEVPFLYMDASYFDIMTNNIDVSQIRFTLRNVDDGYGSSVVTATDWITPVIYSELNNVRVYRSSNNDDWMGHRFHNLFDYSIPAGTYYFSIEIRFITLTSNIDDNYTVSILNNPYAYSLYGIYHTIYEDDYEEVYPPGWIDPIYPDPNVPNLDSDEDVLAEVEPYTNNVLSLLAGLSNSFVSFLVPLGSAFSQISLVYGQMLIQMPMVGNLVEISLYIGLVAFILGSSVAATIFIRRGK